MTETAPLPETELFDLRASIEALATMWEGTDAYARFNFGEETDGPKYAAAMRLALLSGSVNLLDAVRTEAKAEGWDERNSARPQYLGPDDGHYNEDCGGWSDCHCGTITNPYRTTQPTDTTRGADAR